jgi:hypothetical protein
MNDLMRAVAPSGEAGTTIATQWWKKLTKAMLSNIPTTRANPANI